MFQNLTVDDEVPPGALHAASAASTASPPVPASSPRRVMVPELDPFVMLSSPLSAGETPAAFFVEHLKRWRGRAICANLRRSTSSPGHTFSELADAQEKNFTKVCATISPRIGCAHER
jgi:hypothetical protein